jgi:hypothetical protein
MPVYNAQTPGPPALYAGDSFYVFGTVDRISGAVTGEAVIANTVSQQIVLAPMPASDPPSLSVELSFVSSTTGLPAAPGAFDIELQTADTDDSGSYLTEASTAATMTTAAVTPVGNPARFLTRSEFSPIKAKFARLWVKTPPANANIFVIAKLSR